MRFASEKNQATWRLIMSKIFVVMGKSYDIIGRDKFEFYVLLTMK